MMHFGLFFDNLISEVLLYLAKEIDDAVDDQARLYSVPGDSRKFVLLKNLIKRLEMNIQTILLEHFEK